MKNRILVSTLFISSILFASVAPYSNSQFSSKKNIKSFSSTVSLHLYKRGLDKDVAVKKVSQFFIGEDFENDLMVQNILNNFEMLSRDKLISYLADSVLYSKRVDLSSYESVVAIFQSLDGVNLNLKTLRMIEKVTLENEKIRLMCAA
ncbi:MAG: hypothetical protein U9Q40_11770 [Campylobacterota bacterium]|nr:hypothetical protein [Campylobacterota bacterium]